MKKGILGLGSTSTLFYINEINEQFQKKNGGFSTCPFIMYQVNFDEINPFLPAKFNYLLPKIDHYLSEIENIGIEKVLVPNISLHETLDQISTKLKIVHAIDLTINRLQSKKINEILLFGTIFTMNSAYIDKKFKDKNIEIVLPTKFHQIKIDNFRKKVYDKQETASEISEYLEILDFYSHSNTVVLACTELSIYSKKNLKVFDMVQIQIEEFLL